MFENLSMIFNWADKSKITLTRVTDNKMQGNFYSECSGVVVDQDFEAKDLFEFFIKLSLFTEDFGRILHTADEFEKNYYKFKEEFEKNYYKFKHAFSSLTAIDKLVIDSSGKCSAINKSRGVRYTEDYNCHNNFQDYFATLNNQIANFYSEANYFLPLTKEERSIED